MELITAEGEKCFGSVFLKFSTSRPLSSLPTHYPLKVCDSRYLYEIGSSYCFGIHERDLWTLLFLPTQVLVISGGSIPFAGENNP